MNEAARKIYDVIAAELDAMREPIPAIREAMAEVGYRFILIKIDGEQIDTPEGAWF